MTPATLSSVKPTRSRLRWCNLPRPPRLSRGKAAWPGFSVWRSRKRNPPQRQATPENETVQRQATPEEETIQRQTAPDEETVQRQAFSEEETIQRQAASEEETVQRRGQHQPAVSSETAATILTPGTGSPMPAALRYRIEPFLGVNLSGVRIHTDPLAEQAALSLRARAFTYRNHIFLNRTESPSDLSLMAHEATHVVQQGAAEGQSAEAHQTESTPTEGLTESSAPEVTTPAPPVPASEIQPETADLPDNFEPHSEPAAEESEIAETAASAETPAAAAAEISAAAPSAAAAAAAEATQAEEAERMAGVMDRLGQAATEQEGPAASAGSQARASRGRSEGSLSSGSLACQ